MAPSRSAKPRLSKEERAAKAAAKAAAEAAKPRPYRVVVSDATGAVRNEHGVTTKGRAKVLHDALRALLAGTSLTCTIEKRAEVLF